MDAFGTTPRSTSCPPRRLPLFGHLPDGRSRSVFGEISPTVCSGLLHCREPPASKARELQGVRCERLVVVRARLEKTGEDLHDVVRGELAGADPLTGKRAIDEFFESLHRRLAAQDHVTHRPALSPTTTLTVRRRVPMSAR